MNKFKIILTCDFKNMLYSRLEYYYLYSDNYVKTIIDELKAVIDIISKFPYIAPKYNSNKNLRRFVIKNKFAIIYKIDVDEIHMLYFLDGRMKNNSLEVNETVSLIYAV